MEFAGRTIPVEAEQRANEIFARLLQVEESGQYPEDAEEIIATVSGLAKESMDAAVALFTMAYDSNAVSLRTKLAPKLALDCRKVDPESGNRLLHSLLTDGDASLRRETFDLIHQRYVNGKLSYDEYILFYTTFELEAAKEARG